MGWAKILDNIPSEGKLSKLAGVWGNPGRRGNAELPPSPGEQGRGAGCSAHTPTGTAQETSPASAGMPCKSVPRSTF